MPPFSASSSKQAAHTQLFQRFSSTSHWMSSRNNEFYAPIEAVPALSVCILSGFGFVMMWAARTILCAGTTLQHVPGGLRELLA